MQEKIIGIISIAVGCLVIIVRKSFARRIIEDQNRAWGFHFGDRDVKVTGYILIIIGTVAIVFGLLAVFQAIRFK